MYVKEQIGTQKNETVKMSRVIENECYVDGKEPVTPISFTKQDKCIWEYNILGLWSIGECLVENDDCSDIGDCMYHYCCCADHSDWSDCVHSETSCEQT